MRFVCNAVLKIISVPYFIIADRLKCLKIQLQQVHDNATVFWMWEDIWTNGASEETHGCPHWWEEVSVFRMREVIWTNVGSEGSHACPHWWGKIECRKSFAHKSDLLSHMRSHSGVKPYQCFCGKSFSQNQSLQSHGKEHSGEKLSCPNKGCDRKYLMNSCLMIHLRLRCAFQQWESSLSTKDCYFVFWIHLLYIYILYFPTCILFITQLNELKLFNASGLQFES